MSTWISRLLPALALPILALPILALAACVPTTGGGTAQRVPVVGGAVVAAVPAGYCLDRRASHDGDAGAVMLAGRCRATPDTLPAIITVSVGGPDSSAVLKSGARAMSEWFTSRAGRAALARDGRASSVQVARTAVADGALVLLLSDRSVGEYWRAVLGLRGRLVTVSVAPPEGGKLDREDGRQLLDRTLQAMKAANAATNP